MAGACRQVRMGFSVESGSSVADFKAVIAADTGLDPARLLLCQLDDTGFTQTLQGEREGGRCRDRQGLRPKALVNYRTLFRIPS